MKWGLDQVEVVRSSQILDTETEFFTNMRFRIYLLYLPLLSMSWELHNWDPLILKLTTEP